MFTVKLVVTFAYIYMIFYIKMQERFIKIHPAPICIKVLSQIQFQIPNQNNLCCHSKLLQINDLIFYQIIEHLHNSSLC